MDATLKSTAHKGEAIIRLDNGCSVTITKSKVEVWVHGGTCIFRTAHYTKPQSYDVIIALEIATSYIPPAPSDIYLSTCCGAPRMRDFESDICSVCKEHAEFTDDD